MALLRALGAFPCFEVVDTEPLFDHVNPGHYFFAGLSGAGS